VSSRKNFTIIDGDGYIHRAYHALPPLMNSRGEPAGALYGFARMLLKLLKERPSDCVAVCFDTPAPTFRHKAYAQYKAHRKEIDDGLKFQLPLAKEMAEHWGLPVVRMEGWEADDLIAALAARAEKHKMDVTVVSGDKDILQLVDDSRVKVWNETKGVLYDEAEVERKYGLKPKQLVDYFALVGDASDNVPGVEGVGPKTAAQLLQEHGDLDKLYKHLDQLKPALKERLAAHKDDAFLSRKLVTLDPEAPVKLSPEQCVAGGPDPKLFELFKRFEFNSLIADLGGPASLPPPSGGRGAQWAPSATGRTAPGPEGQGRGEGVVTAPAPAVKRTVHTVLTDKELDGLVQTLKKAKALSVDVETTGLDTFTCRLVGIALSVKAGEGWYLPVGHAVLGGPKQLPLEKVRKALAPFFSDAKLPKRGQNLKYDLLVLERHGLPLTNIAFDTLVASYCLNPSRMSHGLKALSQDLLGETMTPIETLIGTGAKQITMDQVPVESAAPYAAADAEVAFRLAERMAPELKEKGMEELFHDVEMPLVEILAGMERAGIKMDKPYLESLRRRFETDIAALEKEMYRLAGMEVNLNSPKQLAVLLFEKLKLPVIKKTKTGFSTDEEVMQKLSHLHPFPAKLLEYRELAKLKSTYVDALLANLSPDTGRVHGRFNQAVAATGRLSSTDPNLQNIPIRTPQGRAIRRAFIPEEGFVLLSADYSQIDLRVLAHMSGDKALREAFKHGEDVHAATAREIFGLKPGERPEEEQRRVAKTVNFGIVYGQTPFGLSQQLGIPMDKAKAYIETYMARYPGVTRWIDKTIDFAKKHGYVTTLLNRRRYLPEINASNQAVRGFAERTAMNTPIQGTSADIIKVAMLEIARLIEKKGWKTRLLLQVHDDLMFEVPVRDLAEVAPLVKKTMESAVSLDVPVVADLKKGVNWAEMEKL
jgi:DNA polymerase-1